MPLMDYMNVHSLLLVGVYFKCIFAFATEYWTHLLIFLAKIQKDFDNSKEIVQKVCFSCKNHGVGEGDHFLNPLIH